MSGEEAVRPASVEGRPLRVMQVHTCYAKYLEDFYTRHAQLAHLPYNEHMRAFVRDAYAATHILTPYLPGCDTMLVVANSPEAQGVWLRENREPLDTADDWQHEVVRRQIARFQPDVLYLTDPIQFAAAFIKSLPWKPRIVAGWRAADVPMRTAWTGFDLMFSNLPRLLVLAESLGVGKGVLAQPAMPSWIAHEVENIPQDVDVFFAGSIYPTQHVRRLAMLEILAEAAMRHGFSLALHLACDPALISPVMRPYVRPAVFGMDMHRALRRGKIVFDVSGSVGLRRPDGSYALDLAQGDTGTMRLFEATGGGSMMLYNDMPGLARIFEPGKEVVAYGDEADLVGKILYYLSHPEEREAIAAAGKARCLGEWNMKNRARDFLEIVRRVCP